MTKQQSVLSYVVVICSSILMALMLICMLENKIEPSIAIPFLLVFIIAGWCFFCMIMDNKPAKKQKIDYTCPKFGSDFDKDTEMLNRIKQDKLINLNNEKDIN